MSANKHYFQVTESNPSAKPKRLFDCTMAASSNYASGAVKSEDRAIRVEDYLNDKLQTSADLENIDTLLENILQQHSLLKEQVWLSRFRDQSPQ